MFVYLVRRVIGAFFTVIGVSTLVFISLHITPGSPIDYLLPPDVSGQASKVVAKQLEIKYGLDKPIWVQYGLYLEHLAHFDLGTSIQTGRPIGETLMQRYPATIELALLAFLVAVAVGGTVGVVSATRPGGLFDRIGLTAAITGLAVPSFWLGFLLMYLFAVKLGWLPPSGKAVGPFWSADSVRHMIMPVLTLAIPGAGFFARFIRASVMEVMGEDYVRTARAKGLHQRTVIWRHVVRNALIPVVTVMGLYLGELLAGAVVTETVFAWPGVGSFLVDGINGKDFPVVQAGVLFVALTFVVTNLVVDLIYGLIDPRISYS